MTKRQISISVNKRRDRDEFYDRKRYEFEAKELFSGIFRRKSKGWIVNKFTAEGWSMSAPSGSIGYLVEREISPLLPTKFAAYRFIAERFCDGYEINF